ncbi:hypothetical protein NMY22_g9951 [Coprinellus aureogranulatus]|nr:hypothetical protein NMY22_g9951 [Coprinellus aureogranulatus]
MAEAINANMIVNYASIGCSALYIADYFQTLPDEIRYMWPTSFSLVKALFLVVRYYPFIHTSISIWRVPAISHLRVYAFSGRNVYILIFLGAYFITVRVVEFYFLTQFIKSAVFGNFPRGSRIGCLAIRGNSSLLSSVFITVLIGVSLLTLIMLVLAWLRRDNIRRANVNGSLASVFARDGVYYFLVLSSLAAANIIVDYTAPVCTSRQSLTFCVLLTLRSRPSSLTAKRHPIYPCPSPNSLERNHNDSDAHLVAGMGSERSKYHCQHERPSSDNSTNPGDRVREVRLEDGPICLCGRYWGV